MLLATCVIVRNSTQTSLWTAVASGVCTVAWAWHRDRDRRQTAERLAAATLETLLNAVDANDEVTGRHMRRTAAYALCMAEALGLSEVDRRKVERVALFHDIGKIHAALFDIVHDDKKLTHEERAQVATHPERGAQVLAPLEAFYPELPQGVLAHHERWDGTGYPHRLKGECIPFFARVVAIADTFDAITHSRRYHSGEGPERGLRAIAEGSGTQFDPRLVDVFIADHVQVDVRRTFEQSKTEVAEEKHPAKPKRAERRSDEPEASVPDVRFRWRTPSTMLSNDPAPGTPGSGAS